MEKDSLSPPFSHSSLLCQEESEACYEQTLVKDKMFFQLKNGHAVSESEDSFVEMLLERETISFRNQMDEPEPEPSLMANRCWIECARRDAVRWILRTRTEFGFGFQTAFLSISYLDRFLLRRVINSEKKWAIRLLSIACLSLAAKMEESSVPVLTEFQVEDYSFEAKVIMRMELLVLSTLQWRLGLITPLDFIHHFIAKPSVESQPGNGLASTAVELILALIEERSSMDHRPSIVAAAAAVMAMEQGLTRKDLELKLNSISSCRFLEIEDVFSCYNLIQQIEMEKLKRPKLVVSPELSPIETSQAGGLYGSSVTSGLSTKRRRLDFSNSDQNCGIPGGK